MIRYLITFIFISNLTQAKHIQMYLQDALNLRLVKASAASLGGFQGFCMNLTIENLTNDSLIVYVEAGRKMNSIDDQLQDILIVKDDNFLLKKKQKLTRTIKGYCCQAGNSSPSTGSKYEFSNKIDSNLYILAKYLNAKSFNPAAEQYAVWAISDRRSTASITGKDDSLIAPLRHFVSLIKKEPVPWYTLIMSCYTYSGGSIESVPLFLKGELSYSLENCQYSTCIIKNKQGQMVGSIIRSWLTAGNNKSYALNVPLKGLEKGKYTIELLGETKSLVSREFEI